MKKTIEDALQDSVKGGDIKSTQSDEVIQDDEGHQGQGIVGTVTDGVNIIQDTSEEDASSCMPPEKMSSTMPVNRVENTDKSSIVTRVDDDKVHLPDTRVTLFGDLGLGQDGVNRSFINVITDTLKQHDLRTENIRNVLLSILTMVSAMLGYPYALIMIDPNYKAQRIISFAKRFVPSDILFEDADLSANTLYMGANRIPGRTIVVANLNGLKKVKKDLEQLVEQGSVKRMGAISSHFKVGVEEGEISGPASLITAVEDSTLIDWNGSNVLTWPLYSDDGLFSPMIRKPYGDVGTYEMNLISKFFERLPARKVDIPFYEGLCAYIKGLNKPAMGRILEPLVSLIAISTSINNCEPVLPKEIFSTYICNKKQSVRNWLSCENFYANPEALKKRGIVCATKVDYYMVYEILGGRLASGDEALPKRLIRIYDAIKTRNLGRAGLLSFNEPKSDVEKLSAISANTDYWADREKIFEMVNTEGEEFISLATLYNELKVLVKKGIIESQKYPQAKNKHGYYALTLDAGLAVTMPHPSTIIDPIYQGKPVKVVNPISGDIEEI